MLGTLTIDVEMDGANAIIKFDHRKVKVPIISVRRLCRDGNLCLIHRKGGYIEKIGSGKIIKFFKYQGVYYVKIKVKGRHTPSAHRQSPFARPAA